VAKVTNVVETVLKARDDMGGGFKSAGKGSMNLATAFKAAGIAAAALTAATVAAGRALVGIARSAAEAGDDAAKAAGRVGLMTEQYTALQFAAERSGASQQSVSMAFRTLALSATGASEGMEEYRKTYRALGVDVKAANGQLKDQHTLFMEVVQGLQGIESQSRRAGLAQRVMGEGASEMMVLLNQGVGGIADLAAEADKYNHIISSEFGRASEQFVDSTTNMKSAMGGAKRAIADSLLPALTAGLNEFAEILADEKMVAGLESLGRVAGKTTTVIFKIVKGAAEATGGAAGGIGQALGAAWQWGLGLLPGPEAAIYNEVFRGNRFGQDRSGRPFLREMFGSNYGPQNVSNTGYNAMGGLLGPYAGPRAPIDEGLLGQYASQYTVGGLAGGARTRHADGRIRGTEEWGEGLKGVLETVKEINGEFESMATTVSEEISAGFAESLSWAFASIVDGHSAMLSNLKRAWMDLIREVLYALVKSGIMRLVMTSINPLLGGFFGGFFGGGGGSFAPITTPGGTGGSYMFKDTPVPGPSHASSLLDDPARGTTRVLINAFGGAGAGRAAAAQFISEARRNGVL
jgi:hypothetical protein